MHNERRDDSAFVPAVLPRASPHNEWPRKSVCTRRQRVRAALSPPPIPKERAAFGDAGARNVIDVCDMAGLLALVAGSRNTLLVLEAHSSSCRACKGIRRSYERVAEQHAHVARFARVSVDEVPAAREHLDIRALPLFVFYKDGRRIDHFASASRERLEEALQDNL